MGADHSETSAQTDDADARLRGRLEQALGRVSFVEPIKGCFNPEFEVELGPEVTINLVITTADSSPPHGRVRVKHPLRLARDAAEALQGDELLDLLRALTHRMLAHEADEALRIDNQARWQPH